MAQEDNSEWYANYRSSGDEIWHKKILVNGTLIIKSSGDEIWHRQMIVNGMPIVSYQEMRYGTRR